MKRSRGGAFADRGVSDLLVARDSARFRGSPVVEAVSPGEALARLSSGRKASLRR